MASLNGAAAIAWMHGKRTNVPGMCLNTVWQAYGSHSSTGPHAGQYPTALDGWNYATKRHTDTNPPPGVPVYYGVSPTRTDANKYAGDVVISLGGGMIIGTDAAGSGRIGIRGVLQRARDISRPYLGWTEDFLGYDIDYPGATIAGGNATPLASEKKELDDMKLIRDQASQTIALLGPGRYYPIGKVTGATDGTWPAIKKVWGDYIDLTHEEFVENVRACCGNIDLAKTFIV